MFLASKISKKLWKFLQVSKLQRSEQRTHKGGLFQLHSSKVNWVYGSKHLFWRREWHSTPVLLPGNSHGQRSQVGCSPWGHWVRHHWVSDFTFTFHFHALEKEISTHSSVLAWRIPGTGEPDRLPSMGLHRVWHDWGDLAAAAAVGSYTFIMYAHIYKWCIAWFFMF